MALDTKKPVLFVVEDDEAWSATLAAKLDRRFEVSQFSSGESVIEFMQRTKPEIMVLDYHLSGTMNGMETLKKALKINPETYIIAFSAQDDVQVAVDILDQGAYDYVVKGQNALERLNIVLNNIEETERLKKEIVNLNLKIKNDWLYLGLFMTGVLIVCFIIYINTCPQNRVIKWDPFDKLSQNECDFGDRENKKLK